MTYDLFATVGDAAIFANATRTRFVAVSHRPDSGETVTHPVDPGRIGPVWYHRGLDARAARYCGTSWTRSGLAARARRAERTLSWERSDAYDLHSSAATWRRWLAAITAATAAERKALR